MSDSHAPEITTKSSSAENAANISEESADESDSNITTISSTEEVTTAEIVTQEMTTAAETQDHTSNNSEQSVTEVDSATKTTTLPDSLTAEGSGDTNTDDFETAATEDKNYETYNNKRKEKVFASKRKFQIKRFC